MYDSMSCQFDKHAFGLVLYLDFIAVGAKNATLYKQMVANSKALTALSDRYSWVHVIQKNDSEIQ